MGSSGSWVAVERSGGRKEQAVQREAAEGPGRVRCKQAEVVSGQVLVIP